ncbi:MAG TPA: type VI secretion system baseplate subunit TssG [Gammaproteobacteria bacterium]|nr:type VI secretion system baseplate subunit TssG [Gammaproteobacteria bacterium]
MAGEDRATSTAVGYELLKEGRRYGFFQAVRLLQALGGGEAAPVGGLGPVAEECLRFRANASLAFPAGDVEAVEHWPDTVPGRYRLTVNFLGLYGPSSPLPAFYTETLIQEDEDNNGGRRDFLDLFNHRLTSLLYRCWEKYRYDVQYTRENDRVFSRVLYALLGVEAPPQREALNLDWNRLLSFLGVLSMGCRSAAVLEALLCHYFPGQKIRIEQCVPRRVKVPEVQRCHLGRRNSTLGSDTYLGGDARGVPDLNGKFRIRIESLGYREFTAHLPGAVHHRAVRDLLHFVLSGSLDFDVALTLQAAEIPRLQLRPDNPGRLGWSAWLGRPPEQLCEVVLS